MREAHAAYRGSWEIARHMEKTILPLRKEIQQESLLHYNGMLKDLSAFIHISSQLGYDFRLLREVQQRLHIRALKRASAIATRSGLHGNSAT